MGISSDGILVYGYDLGDDFDTPPWYSDEDEDEGFAETAVAYLLEKSGLFTETDWEAEGYYKRKFEAENKVGVTIIYHCGYDYPMYILAPKDDHSEFRAYRGYPKYLEADHLNIPEEVRAEWDAKLEWALKELQMTPINKSPQWILTSILG